MKLPIFSKLLRWMVFGAIVFAAVTWLSWWVETLEDGGIQQGLSLNMLLLMIVEGPALRINVSMAKDPSQLPMKFDTMMRVAIGVNFIIGGLIGGTMGVVANGIRWIYSKASQ